MEITHMHKLVVPAGLAAFFVAIPVFSQNALVGKYNGSFAQPTSQGDVHPTITLEIVSVEGDTVKGKAVRGSAGPAYRCAGEYPMEGKVKDSALTLRATAKGGRGGDCDLTFRLTVEGNKLVGTVLNYKTELSK